MEREFCCIIDKELEGLQIRDEEYRKNRLTEIIGDINERISTHEPSNYDDVFNTIVEFKAIEIVNAETVTKGGERYVEFYIKYGKFDAKRRYSEFASLEQILKRIYPTVIVPVIPEKHSIFDLSHLRKKELEKTREVQVRKRMLASFLNRICRNPVLRREHIFHRFLENGVAWTEVLYSPAVTTLPENKLYSSPSRSVHGTQLDEDIEKLQQKGYYKRPQIAADNDYAKDIEIPKFYGFFGDQEDYQWSECEIFTNKFKKVWKNKIEVVGHKISEKMTELNNSYTQLGALLNGFSLDEEDELASKIEHTGQAIDQTYIAYKSYIRKHEEYINERAHEYSQLVDETHDILEYRKIKSVQLSNTAKAMKKYKKQLEYLVGMDQSASLLTRALDNQQSDGIPNDHLLENGGGNDNVSEDGQRASSVSTSTSASVSILISEPPSSSPSSSQPPSLFTNDRRPSPDKDSQNTSSDSYEAIDYDDLDSEDEPLAQFELEQSMLPDGSILPSTIPSLKIRHKPSSSPQKHFEPTKSIDSKNENKHPKNINTALINPQTNTSRSILSLLHLYSPTFIIPASLSIANSLISQLSYKIYTLADIDPILQRRLKIAKLSDLLVVTKSHTEMLQHDMRLINESVSNTLYQFQVNKIVDLRLFLLRFTLLSIICNNKCLKSWNNTLDFLEQFP